MYRSLLIVAVVSLGCAPNPETRPAETPSTFQEDSSQSSEDAGLDSDQLADSHRDGAPPCKIQGSQIPHASGQSYRPPEREYFSVFRPGPLAEAVDSSATVEGTAFQPAEPLEPIKSSTRYAHMLWGTPGENVTTHLTWFTTGAARTVEVTALKNYRSVETQFTLLDSQREEVTQTRQGPGLHLTERRQLAADITLPASAFEPGKAYEISVSVISDRPHTGDPIAKTQRFTLLYGGFDRSEVPTGRCPLSEQESVLTKREHRLWEKIIWNTHGFLYPEGAREVEAFRDPIPAEPGETVSLRMLAQKVFTRQVDTLPVVVVPLLNGRPLGERFVYIEEEMTGRVGYRGQFDVTLPETPGYHNIEVIAFTHAFQVAETLDGEPLPRHTAPINQRGKVFSGLVYHIEDR